MLKNFTKPKKPDFALFFLAVILSLFGIVMIYNASVFEAFQIYADQYHFLKAQLIWFSIGLMSLIVTTFIPLSLIKKTAGVFFGALVPGVRPLSTGRCAPNPGLV